MEDTAEKSSPQEAIIIDSPDRPHTHRVQTIKRRGEMAEAAFLAKASSLGFGVARPWGDSESYDFILDSGERLWRVQVKSSHCDKGRSGYNFTLVHGSVPHPYTADEIDVLVAYIVRENLWYVLPPEAFLHLQQICLRLTYANQRSKYDKYREGWDLMACKR